MGFTTACSVGVVRFSVFLFQLTAIEGGPGAVMTGVCAESAQVKATRENAAKEKIRRSGNLENCRRSMFMSAHVRDAINQKSTELDNLVSAARPELDALNVDIQTNSPSGRDYTIWAGRFTKRWPSPTGFEQASVTMNLECMVPLQPTEIKDVEVSCHATAEIFQIGKSSRVRKDMKDRLLLGQLRSSGIQNLLLDKIEWGRNLLMAGDSAD